jgi:hypothetical protein
VTPAYNIAHFDYEPRYQLIFALPFLAMIFPQGLGWDRRWDHMGHWLWLTSEQLQGDEPNLFVLAIERVERSTKMTPEGFKMDYQKFITYFAKICSVTGGHKDLEKLFRDFQISACRYAHLRAEYGLLAIKFAGEDLAGERANLEDERTRAHNVFIDSCNGLSRAMNRHNIAIEWRRELGDHRSVDGRKMIGDFACFVHCQLAVSAR